MKKLLGTLSWIFMFCGISYAGPISVDQFLSPDVDVTITHLETQRKTFLDALNSFPGDNIQDASISVNELDANATPVNRWNEAFNDWVYTGLLPPTNSAALSTTTTAGTGYIYGQRVVKDATLHTYTASKWTYVDLSSNGTYTYVESDINSAEPGVTANSIRLARVSTDAGQVATVRDDRVLSISLGNQEDYNRDGLGISVVTPDAITADTGVIYHGTTRIKKTTRTSLNIGTASDWATGVSGRAVTTDAYVVINPSGSIKLTTTTPAYVDSSGNTTGKFRYSLIGSTYWRVLSWFHMNNTGSGNIDDWDYSNFSDRGGLKNKVHRWYTASQVTTTTIPYDNTEPTTSEGENFITISIISFNPYSTIKIRGAVYASTNVASANNINALFYGTETTPRGVYYTSQGESDSKSSACPIEYDLMPVHATGRLTFKIRSGSDVVGNYTFNGSGSANLFGPARKSWVTVQEIE